MDFLAATVIISDFKTRAGAPKEDFLAGGATTGSSTTFGETIAGTLPILLLRADFAAGVGTPTLERPILTVDARRLLPVDLRDDEMIVVLVIMASSVVGVATKSNLRAEAVDLRLFFVLDNTVVVVVVVVAPRLLRVEEIVVVPILSSTATTAGVLGVLDTAGVFTFFVLGGGAGVLGNDFTLGGGDDITTGDFIGVLLAVVPFLPPFLDAFLPFFAEATGVGGASTTGSGSGSTFLLPFLPLGAGDGTTIRIVSTGSSLSCLLPRPPRFDFLTEATGSGTIF